MSAIPYNFENIEPVSASKNDFNILDFCVENDLNVLFTGRHGVGKTTKAIEVFRKHKLNWVYFSTSTMDPWVDFIGIPHEEKEGDLSYLGLIRPKRFAEDSVEAIILDEFSRCKNKVRDAAMQLIQFKSINDYEFKNLRMIWAAINPDDDDDMAYDVERLDPAQKDRFHIQIDLPYVPDRPYFIKKFGLLMTDAAIEWWHKLPNKSKLEVSPRRLDYGLEIYNKGLNIDSTNNNHLNELMRSVFPKGSNVTDLLDKLLNGSHKDRLAEVLRGHDYDKIAEFLKDFNNLQGSLPYIIKSQKLMDNTLIHIDCETLVSLVTNQQYSSIVTDFILRHSDKYRESIMALLQYSQYSIPRPSLASLEACYRIGHKLS